MPKLWEGTIEEHHVAVRDAILDATAALVADRGAAGVTMSDIAGTAGIGRATLYKYFSDVDAVLVGWLDRQASRDLDELAAVRDGIARGETGERLRAVLEAFVLLRYRDRAHDVMVAAAPAERRAEAERRLNAFVRALLTDAVARGLVRDDVRVSELASFCVHAVGAARSAPSRAAACRLLDLTLAALKPGA